MTEPKKPEKNKTGKPRRPPADVRKLQDPAYRMKRAARHAAALATIPFVVMRLPSG